MTLPYLIRHLSEDDLISMRGLLAVYSDAFDDAETYSRAPADDDYIRRLLASPEIITVVAEIDGAVVGGLTAYVLRKFEQARSEIYLYDLAVAQAHRRRGIATALIQALKPLARQHGGWVIFVQADRHDSPAIALYEKLGVREDPLHFDIGLEV